MARQPDAARRLDMDFLALAVDEHHRAARHLVAPLEDVEHRVQRRFEVQDA